MTRETAFVPSITDLEPYGDHGWQWTETRPDGAPIRCRTNRAGCGLWYVGDAEDKQQVGTCQFYLDTCLTRAAVYAKIRRYATIYM